MLYFHVESIDAPENVHYVISWLAVLLGKMQDTARAWEASTLGWVI